MIATAGDIEVTNPDLLICHLDEGGSDIAWSDSGGAESMSVQMQSILLIAACVAVLLIAVRTGGIGGGGAGAERKRNPFLFWLGVGITAIIALIAVGIFVSTFI